MTDKIKKANCLCLLSTTGMEDKKHVDVLDDFIKRFFYSFKVKVTGTDCDLKKEIDSFSPELILYMNFPELLSVQQPLTLPTNYNYRPEIPRIAQFGGDKYSPLKYSAYQTILKLKCHAGICSMTVSGELIFEAEELPIYNKIGILYTSFLKDYNEEKIIPVGLFGAGFAFGTENNNHYPWRQKVTKQLLNRIPIFHAPRPSGINTIKSAHDIVKEKYARMINRCKVALTCGTEQHHILEKHLEIPACRTCLVTEESNLIKAYGFKDMENCIFVDETNVCEKLDIVFSNPQKLQEITDAGYEFAQQYLNKEKSYDFYYELFKLLKERKDDEIIVQESINSLKIVKKNCFENYTIPHGPDLVRQHWEAGFNYLLADNADSALQEFNNARSYVSYSPEAITGIGIIFLFSKNLKQAEQCFTNNIAHVQKQAGIGIEFSDPVEISYLAVVYICQNNPSQANRILNELKYVTHPALSAVKAILNNDTSVMSEKRNRKSRIPLDFDDPQKWHSHFTHAISLYKQ